MPTSGGRLAAVRGQLTRRRVSMTSPAPMATARTATTPDDTGSLPVVGMAEVEPGDTAEVVAGPTAPLVVVVVLDALVVVVGLVVVGLVVVGADVALVVVGAVEVVVDAAVV